MVTSVAPKPQPAPYGVMGELATDGVRAQCHICGRWFGHLGNHVVRSHGLDADAYREQFGLAQGTGLIGPRLRESRVEVGLRPDMRERMSELGRAAKGKRPPDTSGRRRREQVLRRKMATKNEVGTCVGCGVEIWVPPEEVRGQRRWRSCGQPACARVAQEVAHTDEWREHVAQARYQGATKPTGICSECGVEFAQVRIGARHWAKRVTCSATCRERARARWLLEHPIDVGPEQRSRIAQANAARRERDADGRFTARRKR